MTDLVRTGQVPLVALTSRTGVKAFDRYSWSHAGIGAVFGLTPMSPWYAFASHVLFEVVEDRIKTTPQAKKVFPETRPDTLANHVGDVVSFMGGFYVGRVGRELPASRGFSAALIALGGAVWGYNARQATAPFREPVKTT